MEEERDLIGYGRYPPKANWPNNSKVALQFVINYEEGGEKCILYGDNNSEHLLSEIVGAIPYIGQRHMNMESLYEYGSRTGFWRLHRLFTKKNIPATVFAVGMALEKNIEAAKAMVEAGWEVASHGYRWIDYQNVEPEVEREHIYKTIEIHKQLCGTRPIGIYQGKPNSQTRSIIREEGGFLYDSDSYSDDLPYWIHDNSNHNNANNNKRPHLIIPYTLSENDMRFVTPNGFNHGTDFETYLKNYLDYLIKEAKESGEDGTGYLMSVGLHCRIVGRPGRCHSLENFIDYALSKGNDVWICRRDEIAHHWYKNHWKEEWGEIPSIITTNENNSNNNNNNNNENNDNS